MKVIACLSWYLERADWLRELVESLPRAGVSHLVAVDGAYALFPDAKPRSDTGQHVALLDACHRVGVELTLHTPAEPWATEMEKRSAVFALAESVTDEGDWYVDIDSDEVVTADSEDPRLFLAHTPYDAVEVTMLAKPWQPTDEVEPTERQIRPHRCLFRAIRGLRVERNHYTYVTPDGRELWGDRPVDCGEFRGLVLDHRARAFPRRRLALDYYKARDRAGLEQRARPPHRLEAA